MPFDEEERVVEIDCEQCPYKDPRISSLELSRKCQKCPYLPKKRPGLVVLKTKYFTKEYSSDFRLLHIRPFFIDVRFGFLRKNFKVVKRYNLPTGAKVRILKDSIKSEYFYELTIPEINISFNQLKDFYEKVENFKKTGITKDEIIKRWYLEYGILEHLLFDEKVLEININPPAYTTSMRIVHEEFQECVTNIFPSNDFLDYLSTRLKIGTGRPLNKAQPQLDGEIKIKNQKARVAAVINPFSLFGTAYSIRKHREKPWTLPLFMDVKELNKWFAGLLSFAITHGRTMLVAGPRGSGKTSLLSSLLLEILPKYRILTIEDTQELPIESYKRLGYDILPLKVKSALLKSSLEMPFDTGLRTSLRLGDSCLIVGEIRSTEAKVLYEAMRVGAMSNVVAGTIHADSPYGVFDRVVNDLDVPKGSFKVTDLIIIVNQIKSATGLSRTRRVLSVTEVLKKWEDKPVFQDLLVYNPKTDELEPTDALLKGKSYLLNDVIKRVKDYDDYNDALNDVKIRGWVKKTHKKLSPNKNYMEAPYILQSNLIFTHLFEKYNPTKSEENLKQFKEAFTKYMVSLFGLNKKD